MQDDATGEESTAYTHCPHLILQVFSPSWCCAALQIPRLSICSITRECAAWMCYEPSALSFLLPPSHPFYSKSFCAVWVRSRDLNFKSVLGWVKIRYLPERKTEEKKRFRSLEQTASIAQKKIRHEKFLFKLLSSCTASQRRDSLFQAHINTDGQNGDAASRISS